jgi:hypothetical protein
MTGFIQRHRPTQFRQLLELLDSRILSNLGMHFIVDNDGRTIRR